MSSRFSVKSPVTSIVNTTNVFLTCQLTIHHLHPRTDTFTLVLFTCPSLTISAVSSYVSMPLEYEPNTQQHHCSAHFPALFFQQGATRLHCWLFCTSGDDDDNSLISQWRYAFAVHPIRQWRPSNSMECKLNDITRICQATLTVTQLDNGCPSVLALVSSLPPEPSDALFVASSRRFQACIRAAYAHIQYDCDTQGFFTYDTPTGTLPILAFVVQAHRLQSPQLDQRARWFRHLTRLACLRLNYKYTRLFRLTPSELGALVVEIFTLPTRALLYVTDFTRDEKDVIIDDWTRIDMAPDLQHCAFDCEDGSSYVVSLLHAFRTCVFPIPGEYDGVRVIQRHLKAYTTAITFVQLWCGPSASDYTPHCTVLLLDNAYVRACRTPRNTSSSPQPAYMPSIMIESTAYIEGVWSDIKTNQSRQQLNDMYITQERAFTGTPSRAKWRRIHRHFLPVRTVEKDALYADVCVLLVPDYQGSALYLQAFPSQPSSGSKNMRLGVPLHDFMYMTTNVSLQTSVEWNAQEIETWNTTHLIEQPLFRLPDMQPWTEEEENRAVKTVQECTQGVDRLSALAWECRSLDMSDEWLDHVKTTFRSTTVTTVQYMLTPTLVMTETRVTAPSH